MRRAGLIALLLVVCGCGGTVDGAADAGSGSPQAEAGLDSPQSSDAYDAGASDAWGVPPDGAAWSLVCPESPPALGSTCSQSTSIQCEYGDAWWNAACDTVVVCAGGHWSKLPMIAGCTSAPTPNSLACPSDPVSAAGAACSSAGTGCYYDLGANCYCTTGPFAPPDASAKWICVPGSGCPLTRPRLGASCNSTSAECVYNGCVSSEACVNGAWAAMTFGC